MRASQPPPATDLTDLELRAAVVGVQKGAFRDLLRRFEPLLRCCIRRVLRRAGAWATDDENEVFSQLLERLLRGGMRRLRAWDPARGASLGAWLARIATNTAQDHLRGVRRRPRLAGDDARAEAASSEPSPLDRLLARERTRTLSTLLAGCSSEDRRFAELYYARGLSSHEVAATLRISVKTVHSRHHKLRHKLLLVVGGR